MDRTILKISIAVGLSIFFTACIKSYTIKHPEKPIEIGQSHEPESKTSNDDSDKNVCDIESYHHSK